MKAEAAVRKTRSRGSCGNAEAVERVESQRQASHSFHEPLGNLAKGGRDSHIPTARAKRLEKWKTKIRFPTFPTPLRDYNPGFASQTKTRPLGGLRRSAPPQE